MTAVAYQEQPVASQAEQCRRLAHVLTLTKEMLSLADAGDWEAVATKEVERRDDLALCFSEATQAADSILIAEAVAALLHLNEELMEKLRVARTHVMEQGRQLSRQQSGANSYREVGAHK